MKPIVSLHVLLLAFAAVTVSPASAQTRSFRCKTDLVNLGDGKASALRKCGEPILKDSFCKPADRTTVVAAAPAGSAAVVVQPGGAVTVLPPGSATVVIAGAGCETVDEWTYNPGHGQFYTTLRFESSRLTEIRYGDRVR